MFTFVWYTVTKFSLYKNKYGLFQIVFFLFFRLDRKSSRGMIYENEELRLRTININAEVERGKRKLILCKQTNKNYYKNDSVNG